MRRNSSLGIACAIAALTFISSVGITCGESSKMSKQIYPAFFRIFVPMRKSFRTVPVGRRFI